MLLDKILKLGDPLLHEMSEPVSREELINLEDDVDLLDDLILKFRKIYGMGRGIAAPQIGLMKRLICLNLKGKRYTIINPKLTDFSKDMMELWDDCMSFPNLMVKVKRHRSCTLTYRDENWEQKKWKMK